MSDQPTQASGGGDAKGAPDGVNDTPAKDGAGESAGGAYPNPQTGKKGDNSGFFGHGGQTDISYSGTGGEGDRKAGNANSVTE